MRRFALPILIAAVLTAACPVVSRAEEAPISVRDALGLISGLRNLDGHAVVIKQNGQDGTVIVPWEFGSGSLRLRISNDLTLLATVERTADEARVGIVKELLKQNGGGDAIKPGTPAMDEFQRQYEQVLNAPAKGLQDLGRIKTSELKLDKNEIPVTVLQALRPILDQDVK